MKAQSVRLDTDADALLARAERIVETARGVDAVEVYLEMGSGLDVELEKGLPASTSANRSSGGSVRVLSHGMVGFAYFTRDEDAASAIAQAASQARHGTVRGYQLPQPTQVRALPGRWDDRIAALDPADVLAMADEVVAGWKEHAPKAMLSGGGVGLDVELCAIASSTGVRVCDRATSAGAAASLVLDQGDRSVSASESRSSHRLDVDARDVAREAAETTLRLRDPKPLGRGGPMEVLLQPEAAASLVAELAVSAATGDDAMRGKTLWSGKEGVQVAHKGLHLADDCFAPGAIGASPFDDEGQATGRLPILDGGVLRTYLFDSWDAHRHQRRTTASAVRGGFKSRPGTGTHHLVLSMDGARPLQDLVSSIDDGLLVESVLGAHTANVTTGEFSVTAPNVWRIERGQVTHACTEVALAGNLPSLLTTLGGASREAKAMDGIRMPHVLLRGVDVSV